MIRSLDVFLHLTARTDASVALVTLLLSASATAQTPAAGQPRMGGTVRIAESGAPVTLNPYFIAGSGRNTKMLAD